MRGDTIFLYPDGDFIYAEWGDIQPPTIFDKGKWRYEDGFIRLVSDHSIVRIESEGEGAQGGGHDVLVPMQVTIESKPHQFILGMGVHYRRLQRAADGNDDLDFLIQARERTGPIEAKNEKAKILREGLRPEYYKTKP